jgi:hypothetical protein
MSTSSWVFILLTSPFTTSFTSFFVTFILCLFFLEAWLLLEAQRVTAAHLGSHQGLLWVSHGRYNWSPRVPDRPSWCSGPRGGVIIRPVVPLQSFTVRFILLFLSSDVFWPVEWPLMADTVLPHQVPVPRRVLHVPVIELAYSLHLTQIMITKVNRVCI